MKQMNENQMKKGGALTRTIRMLFKAYPVLVPLTALCIVFAAVVAALPAIFQQQVIADIETWYQTGDWASASAVILPKIVILAVLYVLSLLAILCYTQLMAYITQGFLDKMRCTMFEKMQKLPIKYFDTHKHGDIMSYYTNDIDSLRQLISQALPTLLQSAVLLVCVFCIMIYYSVWLTLVVLIGVVAMLFVSRKVGSGSTKYFIRQQTSVGKTEGFVQEMMNGQKVIKVFNHEDHCRADFQKINEQLFEDNFRANAYANILGPIIQNIGNVLYVVIAVTGGMLLLAKAPNLGVSSLIAGGVGVLTIDVIVPFLNMSKQFTGNVNQVSQQINSIAMAIAGAERIFSLIDEEPEADSGYVTLVNAEIDGQGKVTETERHTGHWAWKHPHHDGTLTYTPLQGDVVMDDVDFAYQPGKTILHGITLYAKRGQTVAFLGATGAGKPTITHLLHRFYNLRIVFQRQIVKRAFLVGSEQ